MEISRRALWGDQRGFTLAEVSITIVILGIVLAIAIPSWRNVVESRRVDAATNQLVADLRLAHTKSTNQLTEYRVAYRPNGQQVTCDGGSADYCLMKRTGTSPLGVPTFQQARHNLPDGVRISASTLSTDSVLSAQLGSNTRSIRFTSMGTAEPVGGLASGSHIRLTVGLDNGSESPVHVIDLNAETSRVQIDPV